MKIKLLGLSLSPGNGVTLDDMFAHIAAAAGEHMHLAGYDRFMYVDKLDGYHVGLLITAKNHKKFLEYWHDAKNPKLEAKDVSEGAKFADFNFFAINEATGKGIYQYYHQSCSLNMFGMLCRMHYEVVRGKRIGDAKAAIPNITGKDEKRIRQEFSGTLDWEIMVRREIFDQLIEEFKSIKSISLGVSTLAYEETEFTPLARIARKMTQRYSFTNGTAIGAVIKGLRDVILATDVEAARVEGIDQDNLERVIKLVNTPDSFGEVDFDGVAENMTIAPVDFVKSLFVKDLIKIAAAAPALQG